MKINKIYISAFGGLKDFTLEFEDGLNIIYGNNEDGKSTVAAFIKAMFYGTGRNSKSLADSPRQKYTPWDNCVMAGRIYFENAGKNYCLEREFRKSDSTDRILLTDTDSGKTVDAGDSIGNKFFGMSAAAFERSMFIGNADFIKDGAAASEINGKLSNFAVTGAEDVSYKKIEKNIFDARAKLISKSGKSGSYNEDLQLLGELNERLKKADDDAKIKSRLNDTAAKKRAEYEQLYKKYTELKSIAEREQDIKNREKLTEFLETKRELDRLNMSLKLDDGTVINENYTQKIEFVIKKYETCADRCEQINQDISRMKATTELQSTYSPEVAKEQIDRLTAEINGLYEQTALIEQSESALNTKAEELKQKLYAAQNKKAAFNPILLTMSVVFAVLGVAACFLSFIAATVIGGTALIEFIVAFILKPKNAKGIAEIQNELADTNCAIAESKTNKSIIQEQIGKIKAQINDLTLAINTNTAVKEQRLADLKQKEDELAAETNKAQAAKSEIINLLSGFGNIDSIESAYDLLEKLKQKTENQKAIKLRLKTASQFLGNIDYDKAEQKLAAINDAQEYKNVDFSAVKSSLNDVSGKIDELKEQLTVIATELKTSFKHSENPEELKREIRILQEKIDSKKEFCDTADLALSVLEQSFHELRRGFGSELEKQTQTIFSSLTGGKYSNINISDELDISVEQSNIFGTRDIGFLSLGTTHQAYLSLRLAITKLISGDNTMPIFLDDSLAQYDDGRADKAIRFLKEFCADGQGIFFTCHNSVCEIAENQGLKVKKPYTR